LSIRRVVAGTLELGGGLEVLLAASFEAVPVGGELEIATPSRGVALELPAWARISGHEHTGGADERAGSRRIYVVRIKRGNAARILADRLPDRAGPLDLHRGALRTETLRDATGQPASSAPAETALAPIGAVVEAGAPAYAWGLNDRDRLWADELGGLARRAARAQWDANTDIPWEAAASLSDRLEQAVSQVMTYIAQNEYAALYVPSRLLPDVNPQYTEVLLWLSSHIHDEARHVEVFTKRALAGGARSYALASTELSLQTLLEETDFSNAALLLNVLGEGTFLDLLRFIERHAPDAATATAARLAHRDERRHVHFGIAHVRRRLTLCPEEASTLAGAVEARAAKLTSLTGLSPILTEALTTMTAKSLGAGDIGEAAAAVQRLMNTMSRNRIRRLQAAGFDEQTAHYLSELHTPNLM
jgi:hypothetical protein